MPIKQITKLSSLGSFFRVIDSNLIKFYSTRHPIQSRNGTCSCKYAEAQKQQQMNFYCSQRQIINQAIESLTKQDKDQSEQIIGKILGMVVEYINKILQYIQRDYICECKKIQITQSIVAKHKIHFMREQNDKFFKLFEQKNAECQELKNRIKQLQNKMQLDIIPISTKAKQANPMNQQNRLQKQSSFHFNDQKSLKSSKISQHEMITKVEVKQTKQKDHNSYFINQQVKKHKKSKIFSAISPHSNSSYSKN